MMAEQDQFELRSEKVQHLIGAMPPALLRSGIGLVFMLMMLLILSTYIIPYPETMKMDITVKENPNAVGEICAEALVSDVYRNRIVKEMVVRIALDGSVKNEHGSVEGAVIDVESRIVTYRDKKYFIIRMSLPDTDRLQVGMRGTASISLTDNTIWQYLFNEAG